MFRACCTQAMFLTKFTQEVKECNDQKSPYHHDFLFWDHQGTLTWKHVTRNLRSGQLNHTLVLRWKLREWPLNTIPKRPQNRLTLGPKTQKGLLTPKDLCMFSPNSSCLPTRFRDSLRGEAAADQLPHTAGLGSCELLPEARRARGAFRALGVSRALVERTLEKRRWNWSRHAFSTCWVSEIRSFAWRWRLFRQRNWELSPMAQARLEII